MCDFGECDPSSHEAIMPAVIIMIAMLTAALIPLLPLSCHHHHHGYAHCVLISMPTPPLFLSLAAAPASKPHAQRSLRCVALTHGRVQVGPTSGNIEWQSLSQQKDVRPFAGGKQHKIWQLRSLYIVTGVDMQGASYQACTYLYVHIRRHRHRCQYVRCVASNSLLPSECLSFFWALHIHSAWRESDKRKHRNRDSGAT